MLNLSKIKETDTFVEYRIETEIPDGNYKNPYKPEEPLTKCVYGYGSFSKSTEQFTLDQERSDIDFAQAGKALEDAINALVAIKNTTRVFPALLEL